MRDPRPASRLGVLSKHATRIALSSETNDDQRGTSAPTDQTRFHELVLPSLEIRHQSEINVDVSRLEWRPCIRNWDTAIPLTLADSERCEPSPRRTRSFTTDSYAHATRNAEELHGVLIR